MEPYFSPGWQSQRCCYPNACNLAHRKMLWKQNCLITSKAVGQWRRNRLPAGKGTRDALHYERQVVLRRRHIRFSIWSRSCLTHAQGMVNLAVPAITRGFLHVCSAWPWKTITKLQHWRRDLIHLSVTCSTSHRHYCLGTWALCPKRIML